MVHSICDSYPKFGAAAPRQTGVITRRKKWGRLTPPPANAGLRLIHSLLAVREMDAGTYSNTWWSFRSWYFLHETCSCCDLRAMCLNMNRIYLTAAARRLWISLYPTANLHRMMPLYLLDGAVTVIPISWPNKNESLEQIHCISETNISFDSCNSCKRLTFVRC